MEKIGKQKKKTRKIDCSQISVPTYFFFLFLFYFLVREENRKFKKLEKEVHKMAASMKDDENEDNDDDDDEDEDEDEEHGPPYHHRRPYYPHHHSSSTTSTSMQTTLPTHQPTTPHHHGLDVNQDLEHIDVDGGELDIDQEDHHSSSAGAGNKDNTRQTETDDDAHEIYTDVSDETGGISGSTSSIATPTRRRQCFSLFLSSFQLFAFIWLANVLLWLVICLHVVFSFPLIGFINLILS